MSRPTCQLAFFPFFSSILLYLIVTITNSKFNYDISKCLSGDSLYYVILTCWRHGESWWCYECVVEVCRKMYSRNMLQCPFHFYPILQKKKRKVQMRTSYPLSVERRTGRGKAGRLCWSHLSNWITRDRHWRECYFWPITDARDFIFRYEEMVIHVQEVFPLSSRQFASFFTLQLSKLVTCRCWKVHFFGYRTFCEIIVTHQIVFAISKLMRLINKFNF